jgi:hypothetical protein
MSKALKGRQSLARRIALGKRVGYFQSPERAKQERANLMAQSLAAIVIQLVLSTKFREPLIKAEDERSVWDGTALMLPFQGIDHRRTLHPNALCRAIVQPKAMPWAIEFRPFRACALLPA